MILLLLLAAEPPGVAEVRDLYAACSDLRARAKPEVWVSVADYDGNNHRWMREAARDGGHVYQAVSHWFDGKSLRFAVKDTTSASGDWWLTTEYCFRADGSIAFTLATLSTWYGHVNAQTRRYFDPSGREIHSKKSVADFDGGKPSSDGYLDVPAEHYATATKLLALTSPSRR